MANIWLCHAVAMLFVISGIVQAESSIRRNNHELQQQQHQHHNAPFTDNERKESDVWNAPLSLKLQRKKRLTSEEGEEAATAYLEALAGDSGKRGRDSFRGDLGKRMQPMSHSVEKQVLPVFWVPGKRVKVISRFRGDLGKRGKSSYKGDLGKRQFPFATSDDFLDDNRRESEISDGFVRLNSSGQRGKMDAA